MSRKGKWISCFVMVLFGITSFNTLSQSVSASENVIVSSSDREITEPKIIEFGEQGGIQARVQVLSSVYYFLLDNILQLYTQLICTLVI